MRVLVDIEKCVGEGERAAEIHAYGEDNETVILLDDAPPEVLGAAAREAVKVRTVGALSCVDPS